MNEKKWFYNRNLKPQGPFSEEHIRSLIHHGQLGPQDLLLEESENTWKPALEWRCFEPLLYPAHQQVPLDVLVDQKKKDWVLIRSEQGRSFQDGPFAVNEIQELLKRNKISAETLAWKSGLSGWVQLKERTEFQIEI